MAHFVDTNVVIYAFQPGPKSDPALEVLQGSILSVQVLNEFANVCLRKLGYDCTTIERLISDIRSEVAAVEPVTESAHDLAREIVFRYRLGFYDSVLLASALLTDCAVFYSEDLQDGTVIENCLTIRNPFL